MLAINRSHCKSVENRATRRRARYVARIKIPYGECANFNGLSLVSGMPVEVFVQTGERTALSYLLKSLSDQIARAAMRE